MVKPHQITLSEKIIQMLKKNETETKEKIGDEGHILIIIFMNILTSWM